MTTAVVLSKEAAITLTLRIRKAGQDFGSLLLEAQEGEAWQALGYASWGAYIDGEFDFKRSRSYQLLTQARVNRALEDAGSDVRVNEREARDLSTTVDTRAIVHEVTERRAQPLKQRRSKRGMPDKTSVANAISTSIDNFEAKADGYEDEEILSYLTHDERRALERAVEKSGRFSERWGDLLSRPVERRYLEEAA